MSVLQLLLEICRNEGWPRLYRCDFPLNNRAMSKFNPLRLRERKRSTSERSALQGSAVGIDWKQPELGPLLRMARGVQALALPRPEKGSGRPHPCGVRALRPIEK